MEKPPHPIFDRRIGNIERKTKSPAVLHQLLLAGLVVQRGHWSSPRTGRSIRGREPQAKRDCSTAKAGGRSGGRDPLRLHPDADASPGRGPQCPTRCPLKPHAVEDIPSKWARRRPSRGGPNISARVQARTFLQGVRPPRSPPASRVRSQGSSLRPQRADGRGMPPCRLTVTRSGSCPLLGNAVHRAGGPPL